MTLNIGGKRKEYRFQLQGNDLPMMRVGESYRYLRCRQALETTNINTPNEPLKQVIKEIDLIKWSYLFPLQKVDAIRTFVVPKLNYFLRENYFPKEKLDRKLSLYPVMRQSHAGIS